MSSKAKEAMSVRLNALEESIERSLDEVLRSRVGLTLVAVSKRQPIAALRNAYELGVRHFGENQIQEGVPKVKVLPEDITWHFIGHLQKNKVRRAVKHFPVIHSVDSLSLLQRVEAIAAEERVRPDIFLQVNYALDPDKYGLHPEAVAPILETALSLQNLTCIGLMGMPPMNADEEKVKAYFEGMASLRDELQQKFPRWPGRLSLGMSGDFELAIASGSHYIRVGTGVFGART